MYPASIGRGVWCLDSLRPALPQADQCLRDLVSAAFENTAGRSHVASVLFLLLRLGSMAIVVYAVVDGAGRMTGIDRYWVIATVGPDGDSLSPRASAASTRRVDYDVLQFILLFGGAPLLVMATCSRGPPAADRRPGGKPCGGTRLSGPAPSTFLNLDITCRGIPSSPPCSTASSGPSARMPPIKWC